MRQNTPFVAQPVRLARISGASVPTSVYRQRRAMVVLATASLLIAGFGIADAAASHSSPRRTWHPTDQSRPAQLHIVRAGETLWQIARTMQPDGDVRRLVSDLANANGGAALWAGQTIALPPEPDV